MIKELLLALTFGALIGFGVSGTFFGLKKRNVIPVSNITPTPISENITSPSPTSTINSTSNFEIISPKNNALVNQSSLNLKGVSTPKSLIIVSTSKSSYQTETDEAGNFSLDISLEAGANLLKISSLTPTDVQESQEILVTYSTAKIE